MASTGNPVVDAILAGTSNLEVREAMLVGSYLESGWSSTAVGDGGTSFGPFQMHIGGALTAAGGTPAQAENPTWAVQHMLGAYEQGVNSVPSSLWSSNPELAAEEAAVAAERPRVSYIASQGQSKVDQAFAATQNALRGIVSSPGSPTGGNSGPASGTNATLTGFDPASLPFPLNIIASVGAAGVSGGPISTNVGLGIFGGAEGIAGWFLKQLGIDNIKDFFIRTGLIILGGILIIIGVGAMTRETVSDVTEGSGNGSASNAVPSSSNGTSSNTSQAKPAGTGTTPKPATRTPSTGNLKTGASPAVSAVERNAAVAGRAVVR